MSSRNNTITSSKSVQLLLGSGLHPPTDQSSLILCRVTIHSRTVPYKTSGTPDSLLGVRHFPDVSWTPYVKYKNFTKQLTLHLATPFPPINTPVVSVWYTLPTPDLIPNTVPSRSLHLHKSYIKFLSWPSRHQFNLHPHSHLLSH